MLFELFARQVARDLGIGGQEIEERLAGPP